MSGDDIRNCGLNRGEVSNMIGDLKSKGDHFLPAGKYYTDKHGDEVNFICTKEALRKTGNALWEKSGRKNPMSVGAVVKAKAAAKVGVFELAEGGLFPEPKTALGVIEAAERAGTTAMKLAIPTPMVVQQHADMTDDNSPVAQEWHVEGGVCGFAWVNFKVKTPIERKFLAALKKAGMASSDINAHTRWNRDSYYKGYTYWVRNGGRSMTRKEAYGQAFAEVLRDYGINARCMSRMD
jgi:hypothetical protein